VQKAVQKVEPKALKPVLNRSHQDGTISQTGRAAYRDGAGLNLRTLRGLRARKEWDREMAVRSLEALNASPQKATRVRVVQNHRPGRIAPRQAILFPKVGATVRGQDQTSVCFRFSKTSRSLGGTR